MPYLAALESKVKTIRINMKNVLEKILSDVNKVFRMENIQ